MSEHAEVAKRFRSGDSVYKHKNGEPLPTSVWAGIGFCSSHGRDSISIGAEAGLRFGPLSAALKNGNWLPRPPNRCWSEGPSRTFFV